MKQIDPHPILLCSRINGDPVLDEEFDPADSDHDRRNYYVLQDISYNVLGSRAYLGSDGDLLQVLIYKRDSAGEWTTRTLQYRYWVDGDPGGSNHQLKLIYRSSAITRALAILPDVTTPEDLLDVPDAMIEAYADKKLEYYVADFDTDITQNLGWGSENLESTYGGGNVDETGFLKSETIRSSTCLPCDSPTEAGVTYTYYYMNVNYDPGDPYSRIMLDNAPANQVQRIVVRDTGGGEVGACAGGMYRRHIYGFNNRGNKLREVATPNPLAGSLELRSTSIVVGTADELVNKPLEFRLPSAHNDSVTSNAALSKFLNPTDGTNDADTLDTNGIIRITEYDYSNYDQANGFYTVWRGEKNGKTGDTHWLNYVNLTYDGIYHYTYDAWNRMTKVTKAFKECGDTSGGVGSNGTNGVTLGALQLGSVVNEIQYDGLHRRIVKEVKNSADLDMTYHYYYNNQSMVEVHNGSEQVIQQFVWGNQYIDELVEIAVNDDPIGDSDFSESENFLGYYTQHNANFNVIGLTDAAGNLVERYEYTPYGQRQVYKVAGANDPDAHAPLHISTRVEVSSTPGVAQPYALNPIGHQGLLHDEATGLVHNRYRMLNPRLQRFNQRDPLGYVDGMNGYVLYHVMQSGVDPSGLTRQVIAFEGLGGFNDDPNATLPTMGSASWSQIRNIILPLAQKSGAETHYFAQNDVEGAFKKIMDDLVNLEIPDDTDEYICGAYHTLVLVGWSNGGAAVEELAKKLDDEGVKIELAFTIDPVPKGLNNNVFFKFKKRSNVETWHNYYQKFDVRNFSIRGWSVNGADTDYEFKKNEFIGESWKFAHTIIVEHPTVTQAFTKALSAVAEWRETPAK